MLHTPTRQDVTESHVLTLLQTNTYEQVSHMTGWSIGKIYRSAAKNNARKTEDRIRERKRDRNKRQMQIFQEILGTTTTADVLDYMDALPDNCASLILTSPPYNLGKTYGNCTSSDNMRHLYYLGWLWQILSECARTLSDGGTLAIQVGSTRDENETIIPIDSLLIEPARKAGLTFVSRLTWVISHGLTPKKRLAERYETIMVFSKGEQRTFNPGAARTPQKEPGKRAYRGPNKGKLSGHPLGAHPSNVWHIPSIGHRNREKTEHPAQFPEELAMRIINLYTMPGDLVLDPFSGSGTTQACCIRTGRQFSGADIFYEDVRQKRLAQTFPDLKSELRGVSNESLAIWQAEARPTSYTPEETTSRTLPERFLPSETQTALPF